MWDKGLANENFPKHDGGAFMLDSIGFFDEMMRDKPEEILDFSDWMGIPMTPCPVTLDRFLGLLSDEVEAADKE